MNDFELSPSRTVAVYPFAVMEGGDAHRNTELSRGFAFLVHRELDRLTGVESVLSNLFVSNESEPETKSWATTSSMWTLDQAMTLPTPPNATHLLQGQIGWDDEALRVRLELIDLSGGFPIMQEEVEGTSTESLVNFYGMLGVVGEKLTSYPVARRILSVPPTESTEAFEHFVLGLARSHAAMLKMGEASTALDSLARALEIDPDFTAAAEAMERLVLWCVERHSTDAARATLERLLEGGAQHTSFRALLGLAYLEAGQTDAAAGHLQSYVAADPRGSFAATAYALLGKMLAGQSDHAKARTTLLRATALRPDDAESWELLGLAEAKLNRGAAAEEAWRRALQEDPGRGISLIRLAEAYLRRRDFGRARLLLARAVELPAADTTIHRALVRCHTKLRDFNAANEAATAWVETFPEDWDAWHRLAIVRRQLNDRDGATYCLDRAMPLSKDFEQREAIEFERLYLAKPAVEDELRLLLWPGGKDPVIATTAATRLTEICTEFPRLATLWTALAQRWTKAAQWELAAIAQRQAVELCSERPELKSVLGKLLLRSGQPAQALIVIDECLEAAPNDVEMWVGKGRCHGVLGNRRRAAECYERALELEPTNEWASRFLDALATTPAAQGADAKPLPASVIARAWATIDAIIAKLRRA